MPSGGFRTPVSDAVLLERVARRLVARLFFLHPLVHHVASPGKEIASRVKAVS
jgi:hypothetical protein